VAPRQVDAGETPGQRARRFLAARQGTGGSGGEELAALHGVSCA
jgi:hypothetical protein